MDVSPSPTTKGDDWAEQVSAVLLLQRQRVREFLAAQQQRLRYAEGELRRQLEQVCAERPEASRQPSSSQEVADLRDRYDMALDEIRELKGRNTELQRALSQVQAVETSASTAAKALDWEAEKRRVMAALEEEDGVAAGDAEARTRRDDAQEAMLAADRLLAEKDRQIGELQKRLEAQPARPPEDPAAAEAKNVAAILDADEVIRKEREDLAHLKNQWEEKLRHAEVELAQERAKIARQQAEIAEKMRALDQHRGSGSDEAPAGRKTPSGRWLTRLGLKDPNEK